MATLRSLQIILGAKTTVFDRRMRKSAMRVRKFAAGVGRITKRLMQFGAVAAGVAAAGLTIMVKREFAAIDALGKLSDRIGVSTQDLARLGHAADIMGSSQEAMNKALEIFVRRMGEARQGIGEAKDALTRLGLNVDELVKHSPAEAMALISDRMRALTSNADKAATAYQLFGRQGQKLLNLLNLSAVEFRRVTGEADKLALTFTRMDAEKIMQANDAITRMKGLLRGIARTVAIQIAPVIERVTTGFVEWATSGDGVASKVVRAMASITEAAGELVGMLHDAHVAMLKIGEWGKDAADIVAAGAKGAVSFGLWGQESWRENAPFESPLLEALHRARKHRTNFEAIVRDMRAKADELAVAASLPGKGISIAEIGGTMGILGMFERVGETIRARMVGPLGLAVEKFRELQKAGEALRVKVASFAEALKKAIETPAEALRRNLKDLRLALEMREITQRQFERGAKMFLERAIKRAGSPFARDPGQFRALSRGVSVAGLTVGAGERIQNKQLTELEQQTAILQEINRNTQSGGMPR